MAVVRMAWVFLDGTQDGRRAELQGRRIFLALPRRLAAVSGVVDVGTVRARDGHADTLGAVNQSVLTTELRLSRNHRGDEACQEYE